MVKNEREVTYVKAGREGFCQAASPGVAERAQSLRAGGPAGRTLRRHQQAPRRPPRRSDALTGWIGVGRGEVRACEGGLGKPCASRVARPGRQRSTTYGRNGTSKHAWLQRGATRIVENNRGDGTNRHCGAETQR